jgi:exodeoxyribonuclease V
MRYLLRPSAQIMYNRLEVLFSTSFIGKILSMPITLSGQQEAGMAAILEFLDSDRQVFQMDGYAGTGKTTLLVLVAQAAEQRDIKTRLCAFTGKAASILEKKSAMRASTIHGLHYKLVEVERDKRGKKVLQFARVEQDFGGSLVLVDESSMISEEIGRDLLQTGAKIIAFGDPGQLPPVKGVAFFNKPDFILTEIHRQALESAIIRQAHNVREHGRYEADTDDFRVGRLRDDDLRAADVLLCFRNNTRHRLNTRMRDLFGREGIPRAGEPVMCLKNARRYGIFNGAVYALAEDFGPDDPVIYLEMGEAVLEVPNVGFVEPGGSIDDFGDGDPVTTAFDFGYALTVHKAQGSEWDKVALFDEYHREGRSAWCYTGISRAAKSIMVQP